jgi:hypothetical protein
VRCRRDKKPDPSRKRFEGASDRGQDPTVVGVCLEEAKALVQATERDRLPDRARREPAEETELLASVPSPEAECRGGEAPNQRARFALGDSPAACQTWWTRCLNCSLDTLLFDVRGSSSTKKMCRGFL